MNPHILTVVLALRDRPVYTMRLMRYLNATNFPFRIFIADGGKNKRIERILSERTTFRNIDYIYVRYPYDAVYLDFYKKLHDSVARIDSKYVAFADNDNFFSIPGLILATEFLEANPNYGSCQGDTIGFRLASSFYYSRHVRFSRPLFQKDLPQDTALDRLRDVVTKNFATYYAVQRTDDLRQALLRLAKDGYENLNMFEFFLHFATVSAGRVRSLPVPFMYRQFETFGSSNDEQAKKATQFDRLFFPRFSHDLENLSNSIAGIITSKEGAELEVTKASVRSLYKDLLTPIVLHELTKLTKLAQRTLKARVFAYLSAVHSRFKVFLAITHKLLARHSQDCLCFNCEKLNLLSFLTSRKAFRYRAGHLTPTSASSHTHRQHTPQTSKSR